MRTVMQFVILSSLLSRIHPTFTDLVHVMLLQR